MVIKVEDLKKCSLRITVHLNGGQKWAGYVYTCNEYPRLQRTDRFDKKNRKTTITYQVDGEDVSSLSEAVERLNHPPVITAQMQADLDAIGTQFGDHRKSIGYERLKKLSNCNLIEWGERGMCRSLTVTGVGSRE